MTRGARIDPADGTIAEAAPLGNDMSLINSALVAFKVGPGRYCYEYCPPRHQTHLEPLSIESNGIL